MNLKALLMTVSIVIIAATELDAQEPFFYDGTRPLSMGKALTGLADDGNTLFYNPAGLTSINGRTISLSGYIQQFSWQSSSSVLEGIQPNFTDRGFSISYVQHRFGISFSQTGKGWWDHIEFGDWQPEGLVTHTTRPVNYERFVTAGYAHEIVSWINLGVTGKYIHFSHHSDTDIFDDTNAFTFDIGLLFLPTSRLSFGLNLQNVISTDIDYFVYNDFTSIAFCSELPVNLTFGAAWLPIDEVTIAGDVRHITQDDAGTDLSDVLLEFKRSWHLGIEWRPVEGLALRAGYYRCERPVRRGGSTIPFDYADYYEYRAYDNLTLGAGYSYRNFSIDLGVKFDDRESYIDESIITLREGTEMGSASISYSF